MIFIFHHCNHQQKSAACSALLAINKIQQLTRLSACYTLQMTLHGIRSPKCYSPHFWVTEVGEQTSPEANEASGGKQDEIWPSSSA